MSAWAATAVTGPSRRQVGVHGAAQASGTASTPASPPTTTWWRPPSITGGSSSDCMVIGTNRSGVAPDRSCTHSESASVTSEANRIGNQPRSDTR